VAGWLQGVGRRRQRGLLVCLAEEEGWGHQKPNPGGHLLLKALEVAVELEVRVGLELGQKEQEERLAPS